LRSVIFRVKYVRKASTTTLTKKEKGKEKAGTRKYLIVGGSIASDDFKWKEEEKLIRKFESTIDYATFERKKEKDGGIWERGGKPDRNKART